MGNDVLIVCKEFRYGMVFLSREGGCREYHELPWKRNKEEGAAGKDSDAESLSRGRYGRRLGKRCCGDMKDVQNRRGGAMGMVATHFSS